MFDQFNNKAVLYLKKFLPVNKDYCDLYSYFVMLRYIFYLFFNVIPFS